MFKRLAVFLFLSLSLAACGGGGGGSASGGTPPVTTPPVTTQAKIQTLATQRAVATQSLQGAAETKDMYSFIGGGTPTASVFRQALDRGARAVTGNFRSGASVTPQASRRAAAVTYGPCQNGVETAQVNVSSTEAQLYVRAFYDSVCSQLHQDLFLDLIATSSSAVTAAGNETQYTTAGVVFEYNTLVLSFTGVGTTTQGVSLLVTDAVNQTSPQLGSIGIACALASSATSCGFGAVAHSSALSQDGGATLNVATSITGSSSTGATVAVNGNGSAYGGSLNALSLAAGTFPAWNISGGTLLDSATLSGQFGFSTLGLVTSGTLTLTDAADDGIVAMTGSSTGVAGTIKQTSTGQQVATFSVDQDGNGTVNYSSGVVGQVVAWQVIS